MELFVISIGGPLGADSLCVIGGGKPQRCSQIKHNGAVGMKNPALYYPAEK